MKLALFVLALIVAKPAYADLCNAAFVEALRDRLDIAEDVNVFKSLKESKCEGFRKQGSYAFDFSFFDIFSLGSSSSSAKMKSFCFATDSVVDVSRLRTEFSSGLPREAIHLLSRCAPNGTQATIETLTDNSATIRLSFVDYTRNDPQEMTISGIEPKDACTAPPAGTHVGPLGIEISCTRGKEAAEKGKTITIRLRRSPEDIPALQKVIHIPPDRFIRTTFTLHEFRAGGKLFWRCVEDGARKPQSGEPPLATDIVCAHDVCDPRPRATWHKFCKAELGFAQRISPSGSSAVKFDWETKLRGRELTCHINGRFAGKTECGDTRCRSPQYRKAVCYERFAPPETLPNEQ